MCIKSSRKEIIRILLSLKGGLFPWQRTKRIKRKTRPRLVRNRQKSNRWARWIRKTTIRQNSIFTSANEQAPLEMQGGSLVFHLSRLFCRVKRRIHRIYIALIQTLSSSLHRLTESLEVDDFSLTQKSNDVVYIGVI